ncbi:MAG: hypothetical protein ACQCN5_12970 [Candidatus Bathyarchaeia archaeon]
MMLPDSLGRKLRFAFHSLGLSCLGGAIFLQILVFSDIVSRGYFLYIYQKLMRQTK